VRQVVSNGRVFTVDGLLAPFVTATAAVAESALLPRVPDHPANAQYWWHDPHYVADARHACCLG
jgi:hypothetical protein